MGILLESRFGDSRFSRYGETGCREEGRGKREEKAKGLLAIEFNVPSASIAGA
jgi:hypothetical protein